MLRYVMCGVLVDSPAYTDTHYVMHGRTGARQSWVVTVPLSLTSCVFCALLPLVNYYLRLLAHICLQFVFVLFFE